MLFRSVAVEVVLVVRVADWLENTSLGQRVVSAAPGMLFSLVVMVLVAGSIVALAALALAVG